MKTSPRVTRRLSWTAILVMANASCSGHHTGPQPIAVNTMHARPFVEESPSPSYISPYATSTRASRVSAKPGAYPSLEPFFVYEGLDDATDPRVPPSAPKFVLVSPDGLHVVIDEGSRVKFLDSSGDLLHQEQVSDGDTVTALNETVFINTFDVTWDGSQRRLHRFTTMFSPVGTMYAFRCRNERFGVVFHNPRISGPSYSLDEFFSAQTAPVQQPLPWMASDYIHQDMSEQAGRDFKNVSGVGAIAEDWRSVVALSDRRFVVLAKEDAPNGDAVTVTEVTLPYLVSDLSIASPCAVLLVREGLGTRTVCVDVNGREQWSASLPFRAYQPPIDGGNGRVYVAGEGLAALQDGRVVWQDDAPLIHRATAFKDGSLAVTAGARIQLVRPDGSIAMVHAAPNGEEFLTPPAISADGSVWAATASTLYVARPSSESEQHM